jgi:Flp pilus assembly protein CpaB
MRGGRAFIIIGIVLFVGALAIGAIYLIRSRRPTPAVAPEGTPQPTEEPRVEIVVAAQNIIPRGTRITEENNAVKLAPWPQDMLPPGALTELEAAYGRIARVDILLDMPVTENMLTEEAGDLGGIGSDAALQIPPGRVAYALPVSRYSSVAWAIQPGDHVDMLISFLVLDLDEEFQTVLPFRKTMCVAGVGPTGELQAQCSDVPYGRTDILPNGVMMIEGPLGDQQPRLVTQMTIQDMVVLHVGDWPYPGEEVEPPPSAEEPVQEEGQQQAPPPEPTRETVEALTLSVTPQDAVVLKYAEEMGASMDLVLRSVADAEKPVTTEAVTLQYVFDRFQIEAPPKLPYGVSPPLKQLQPGAAGKTLPLDVEGGRVGELGGAGEAQ